MFNERLKEARIRAGYTQQQVADVLKISRPIYNQIEVGKILPNPDDVTKIEKFLNLSMGELSKHMCIHTKTECIHRPPRKSNTSTYKLTVLLNRGDFPKLTKSNLKKAGYQNLQQFIAVAYQQLENQLNEK